MTDREEPMNELERISGVVAPVMTNDQIAGAIDNPLRLLPADWRPVVWGFWAKFASLLRSQLDLAATLRDWVVEEGLTLAEAQQAFRAVSRPDRRAGIQFPGQVVGELAKEVARLVELRRQAERRRDDKRRAEESESRADPEGVRKLLASIGVGGE